MKKSMKNSIVFLSLAVAGIIFTGCSKDEDGTDVSMKVALKMNNTLTSTMKAAQANSLEFHTGSVTIREIVFDGDLVGSNSVSITHEQVSTIDLASGIASPEVNVIIPPGEYNSVNLGIEIQDVNDIPTVIAEGNYTDADNVVTPLRFEFKSGEVFEAEAESHTFEAGSPAIAEIDFSPADWFSTITSNQLNNATRVNDTILVNEENNSGIFDIVADKLDDATEATFK